MEIFVTNNSDQLIEGSFRHAIEQANNHSSIDLITFRTPFDINISSPTATAIRYEGSQNLEIKGLNQSIVNNAGDINLFEFTGRGSLSLSNLTFDGGNNNGSGIYADVPDDLTGDDVSVSLNKLNIINNGLHGVHIDDLGGAGVGIHLEIDNSNIINNGIGVLDQDGVRVDERGEGDIKAVIENYNLDGNGADGLELDEGGNGDVILKVKTSTFNGNAFFDASDFDDALDRY